MERKKAVVYCSDYTKGFGIGETHFIDQQEAIEAYADVNNLEIIQAFPKEICIGVHEDENAFSPLYSYLAENKETVDEVLFYSMEQVAWDKSFNENILWAILDVADKVTFVKEGISADDKRIKKFLFAGCNMINATANIVSCLSGDSSLVSGASKIEA